MPEIENPSPSMRNPPSAGPTANPIGPDAPKIPMIVPSRCRGTTSRIPASITPVLPSCSPIRRMLSASCQGSRDKATQANTTASTSALRTMTALRLYLSAQTPHSGTNGAPTTKMSDPNSPTNGSRSASGTPISRRYEGRNAKTWLTPSPSTSEVIQKIATMTRQSSRPVAPSVAWLAELGCDDMAAKRTGFARSGPVLSDVDSAEEVRG